jgi:hypothetical protein
MNQPARRARVRSESLGELEVVSGPGGTRLLAHGVLYADNSIRPSRTPTPWLLLAAAPWTNRSGRPADETGLAIGLLGFGTGTVARLIRRVDPTISLVGVEPDRAVRRLAGRHFGTGALKVSLVPTDARTFLGEDGMRFDALIDDIYAPREGRLARPLDTAGLPAFARRRLKPGGVYAVNLISPGGAVERETIDSARSAYRHLAMVYTREFAHRILLASDRPFPRGSVIRELRRILGRDTATMAGLAVGPVRRLAGRGRHPNVGPREG